MWFKDECIGAEAEKRRKKEAEKREGSEEDINLQAPVAPHERKPDHRVPHERDLDRLLYCPAYRRLADKTQVYPMEEHDSVRTRLTHSHEVRNIAYRLGQAVFVPKTVDDLAFQRSASALLAAIGLAHDLGNPPFGHVGEKSIQRWFEGREKELSRDLGGDQGLIDDFLKFDGNPQAIRIVTRLQLRDGEYGLDLCAAAIAGLKKYHREVDSKNKKVGYFASEQRLVEEALHRIGRQPNEKPFFAWIAEGCDDLVYSILDIEDAIVKGNLSIYDVLEYLDHTVGGSFDGYKTEVIDATRQKVSETLEFFKDEHRQYSISDLNQLAAQRFRTYAITFHFQKLVHALHQCCSEDNRPSDIDSKSLTEFAEMEPVYSTLKGLARRSSYQSLGVLRFEAQGERFMHTAMDALWLGISDYNDEKGFYSRRQTPLSALIWNEISSSQRGAYEPTKQTIAELGHADNVASKYAQYRLLTDMVSGMTDTLLVKKSSEWAELLTPPVTHEFRSNFDPADEVPDGQ